MRRVKMPEKNAVNIIKHGMKISVSSEHLLIDGPRQMKGHYRVVETVEQQQVEYDAAVAEWSAKRAELDALEGRMEKRGWFEPLGGYDYSGGEPLPLRDLQEWVAE